MKQWKSRVPKKRKLDGREEALTMILFPAALLLAPVKIKKRRRRRK